MRILDRVRKGTTVAEWIAIGISVSAVFFTGLSYKANISGYSPDVRYSYTISRDLNFKEGFDFRRCPEIQNSYIVNSAYYDDIKERESELKQGTRFLWLVIRNEGEGRAKGCCLRLVSYMFRRQMVAFDDAPPSVGPTEFANRQHGRLPNSIDPKGVAVLLCEDFVPSEGKNPDKYIKENMSFEGFTVETRIKSIFEGWPFTAGFNENHAREMWPRYSEK